MKETNPKWWRGLPSLLLMMIIANIDVLILNDFIVHRFSVRYGLNSTSSEMAREVCLNESSSSSSSQSTPISNQVQSSTARLNVYIYLAATVPAILTSIVVGSNCDRIGRKSLIALPFIGKSLRYALLFFSDYYNLPDWCLILSVMFDGLCGAQS